MAQITLGEKLWDAEQLLVAGPGRSFVRSQDDFAGVAEGVLAPPPPFLDNAAFAEDSLQTLSKRQGIVQERFAEAASKMGTESEDPSNDPSCSVVTVTSQGNILEIACVGTCLAIVRLDDGSTEVVSDTRSEPYDKAVARAIQVEISQGLGYPNALERVTKLIRKHATRTQQDEGPWYFSTNPDVAFELRTKQIKAKKVSSILLLGQGLEQTEQVFSEVSGIGSKEELLDAATNNLDTLGRGLRALQKRDPETARFQRTEPLPDIAAVLLRRV